MDEKTPFMANGQFFTWKEVGELMLVFLRDAGNFIPAIPAGQLSHCDLARLARMKATSLVIGSRMPEPESFSKLEKVAQTVVEQWVRDAKAKAKAEGENAQEVLADTTLRD